MKRLIYLVSVLALVTVSWSATAASIQTTEQTNAQALADGWGSDTLDLTNEEAQELHECFETQVNQTMCLNLAPQTDAKLVDMVVGFAYDVVGYAACFLLTAPVNWVSNCV